MEGLHKNIFFAPGRSLLFLLGAFLLAIEKISVAMLIDFAKLPFINQNGVFFLKAFLETRNLRCWKAKSEQLTSSDKNHSHI